MISWLTAHWGAVALVLWVVINACNAITRHWSEHTGLVRVLLVVVEVLSVVQSRGAGGWIKPPGLPILLALALLTSGCPCSTTRCYIARAETALEACDPLAVKAIEEACRPQVQQCKGGEDCPALRKCELALTGYQAARRTLGTGLIEVNRVLEQAGVK